MENTKPVIIAIDGPAASGKGSLARKLAEELDYEFMDTGALYRRVALKIIENNVDLDDKAAILACAKSFSKELQENYNDTALRNDKVGGAASRIAQIQEIRDLLIDFQRDFAKNAEKGAVLDGRDIGTVICPDADFKFFITASTEKRAERRFLELQSRGINATKPLVLAEMQERDARDNPRLEEHLIPSNTVNIIDTSDMTPREVLETALKVIHKS